MAKVTYSQSSFGSGELSPRALGRTDLERYKTGLALCENMIVLPHGGVMRRPGFEFIHEVKDSTKYVELVPFEFSEDQAYVLEFGDLYMRVYMDGGLVVTPDAETVLLLHCDGDDGDITFTDESITPHTMTATGNAQVDTAYYKFATGSLLLDGYVDYLSTPDDADFSFSNGAFTIDCWIRIHVLTTLHTIYSQQDATAGDVIWFYYDSVAKELVFRAVDAGALVINLSASATLAISTWYHVAVSQDATNIQLYVDGIEVATQAKVTVPNHTGAAIIGMVDPTGTESITHFWDHGESVIAWTTNGNTVRSSTVGNPFNAGRAIKFDGAGDYLSALDNAAFDVWANANADTMISCWVYTTSNNEDLMAQVATVAGADNYWRLAVTTGGYAAFYLRTAATNRATTASINVVVNDGAWHNLTMIQKGKYGGFWVDGQQGGLAYSNVEVTIAGPMTIGYGATDYLTGYMDDVLVEFLDSTVANTRYKADPRTPWTDTSAAARGVCTNVAYASNPVISSFTAGGETKWGNGALWFDGTDDYLFWADHDDWNLCNTTNYTIQFWVKFDTHAGVSPILTQYQAVGEYWTIYNDHAANTFGLHVQTGGGGEEFVLTTAAFADQDWHHVALCKVDHAYGLFIDHLLHNNGTFATHPTYAGGLFIGGSGANFFDGYLDEIYITKSNYYGVNPADWPGDMINSELSRQHGDGEADSVLLMHCNYDALDPLPGASNLALRAESGHTKVLVKGYMTSYDGHMDEFRICKGAGRWSSDFSVATSEYPGAGGGDPYELVTTYTDDDIADIRTVQSADVLYMAHPDFNVMKLARTDHDNWSITSIDWNQPAWNDTNTTAITLDPSAVTGNITVVASAAYFDFNMVGTYFWMDDGFFLITAVTNPLLASATVKDDMATALHPATAVWKRSLWDAGQGYPSCLVFHDDRLVLSGIPDHPLTICFSQVGDYENFDVGTALDDEAIIVSIMAQQQDAIKWMLSTRRLFVGTVSGEYWVSGTTLDTPVTPTSVLSKAETRIGSEGIAPVMLGSSVLFVQDGGERLRIWTYSMQIDGWECLDMSMMSEHLTVDNAIQKIQYSQFPHSVLWATTLGGVMIGVTAIPDQKIISFHQHTTGVTDTIESIAVIPGYLDDELWIVANRTIGASTKRYVERMHDQFYQGAIADAFFVDSGLSYSGAPAVTFYGMDHLEGETVQVLADGIYVGTEVIASGEFTIAVAASTVHAGIAYNSDIKTLPWELGRDGGSSDTTKKRIIGCNIKVYETSELQFGRDATHLMDIPMTDGTLYTDWIYREFNGDFLRNPTVYMRQNKPLPATILSIGADIDVGGK